MGGTRALFHLFGYAVEIPVAGLFYVVIGVRQRIVIVLAVERDSGVTLS